MRIKNISYRDFKGLSDTLELDRPTLLTGPNGSGKTARMLGPQFAVTGRTPFGARPEDAFKLAGPVGCKVSVRLDDGLTWSRELRFDPMKKTLSMNLNITGREELGLRAAESSIRDQVGDFAPMFDLGSFLDLSSDKRRAFVLELCARSCGGESSDQMVLNRDFLVEVLKIELGEGTVTAHIAASDGDLEGLWPKLGADKAECLRSILAAVKITVDRDPATAISEALASATELLNRSKGERDRAHQAARKLAEQKQTITVVAGSIGELKQKRADLARQLKEIGEQIANQAGRADAREAIRQTIQDWTDRLAENQRNQGILEKSAAADTKRRAELEQQIAAMAEPSGQPDLAGLLETCESFQAVKVTAEKTLGEIQEHGRTLQVRVALLEAQIEAAVSSPWRKALSLIDALDPKAAILLDKWQELRQLIRKNAAIDHAKALIPEFHGARDSVEDLTAGIDTATSQLTEATVALDVATAQLKAAQKEEQVAAETDGIRRETRVIALKELYEIRFREEEVKRLKAAAERLTTEGAEYDRRLTELEAAGGHVPIEELREQESNLDHLQDKINLELEQRERYQVLETELTRCIALADHQALSHETCKSVCTGLRAMRERLMVKLVAPLLDQVNRFLAIAQPSCSAYCDLLNPLGRPVFELGWICERASLQPQRVCLPALSAGETAIFGAALAYALVTLSDTPLKLLLLEVGEVDVFHLHGILQAVHELRGDLSNVMIATHLRPEWHNGGWNIIKL